MKSVIKTLKAYSYSNDEKRKLIEYMTKYEDFAVAGRVKDIVENKELQKDNLCYTDGSFVWCTQDIYHIEKYNAAVTEDFLKAATGSGQSR